MAVLNSCPLCGAPPRSFADKGHYYVECPACTEGLEIEGFWITHELCDLLTRSGHPFQTVRKGLVGLLAKGIGHKGMRPLATKHADKLMGG